MKLIAQVKLLTTPEQLDILRFTLKQTNLACQWVSDLAWDNKVFNQYELHNNSYHMVREKFQLSAQITVRVISKVADTYKYDRKAKRKFRSLGSIAYDDRILSWKWNEQTISIWTVAGRMHIPFVCGNHQLELLRFRKGESDLVFSKGNFFLYATCDMGESKPIVVEGTLGVDLGIVNLAVDSDGEIHTAKQVNNVRCHQRHLRARLQTISSRSARRKIRKLSCKEHRFVRNINHCVSKHLVAKAKDTNRAIALENLRGIRSRITVRRSQRATLHNWAFYQLQAFVIYKAKRSGVPVILVDPRNTSRTCPACGHVNHANRINQSTFSCVVCGFAGLADHVAAINIGRRAAVNQPIVARDEVNTDVHSGLRKSVATNHPL